MPTINWLHLSDWHQKDDAFDRTVVRDALLKDLREREKISPDLARIDFVFFTGDLAWSGKEAEYNKARATLLDPVLDALKLDKNRLFLIPGNHDLDRDRFKFLPTDLRKPFESEKQVQEWLGEKDERDELLKPFRDYQKFVDGYGVPGFGSYGDHRIVPFGDMKIGIFGGNSALMCARNTDAAGKINDLGFLVAGEQQVYEHLEKLAQADVRIGLIHHPFEWLSEFDRTTVERRLRRGCHFVLRGHQHFPEVQVVQGTTGNAAIIPGGACYDGRIPERPIYANAYNFVHHDTDRAETVVYLRRLSTCGGGVTAATAGWPIPTLPTRESSVFSVRRRSVRYRRRLLPPPPTPVPFMPQEQPLQPKPFARLT